MHDPSAGRSGKIRESKTAWLDRLDERIGVIADGWYGLTQVNWDPDRLNRLHRQIKALATDSGRFGLAGLSDALSILDICLNPHLSSDLRPSPQKIDEIFQGIRALKSAAEATVRLQAKASTSENPPDTSRDIDGDHNDLIAQTRLMAHRELLDYLSKLVLSDPLKFGAILVVELDGLEQIRSQRGEDAGEALVNEASALFIAQLESGDAASRTGEGTWTIVARRSARADFTALAEQLRRSVAARLFLSRNERITATASIGLCEFKGNLGEARGLIAQASHACTQANTAGGNRVEFRTENERQPAPDEAPDRILKRVQEALKQDGFRILLKPRINLRNRLPALYELAPLLPTPAGADLSRSAFFGQARDANLLDQVDRWIIEQALTLMDRNRRAGVTVNLAVKQGAKTLRDPARLEWLREQLRTRHLVGTGLKLEFSLPELAADLNATAAFAETLSRMGIGLSLSGFKAEATAFEALQHLPVEYVELDRRTTAEAPDNLSAVVDNIQRLGIEAVAANDDALVNATVADIVFPAQHQEI